MADLTDVETALAAAIYAAVYPNGSPPSVLGVPVKIYPGWPDAQTLEKDLRPTGAGSPPSGPPTALHVSIYPRPGDRDTTRYPFTQEEQPLPAPTYTLTQAGQVVTVGGAAPGTYFAQNLAIFVNGLAYIVTATTGQTPAQLASALQALINTAVPGTTVSGAAITIPSSARIGALRVGVTGTALKEVGRQEKQFQVSLWADAPANRSALAKIIEPVLSDTPRLTSADGSIARVKHFGGSDNDFDQKQGIYRRDLIYTVEWATVRTFTAPQIVEQIVALDDPQGNLIATTYS